MTKEEIKLQIYRDIKEGVGGDYGFFSVGFDFGYNQADQQTKELQEKYDELDKDYSILNEQFVKSKEWNLEIVYSNKFKDKEIEQLQARINEQKTKYGELVTLYEENLGQLLDAAKQNKQLQAKIDELKKANEWISVEELNPEYYEKVLIECSGNLSNDNYSYYDVAVFTRDGWVGHLYKHPSVIKWKKITN